MKTIAILACKLLRFAGKLLGKGSSLPGSVALKLDPDILQKIKLPDRVIAVTGSNGKTSTVEMIAHVLRQNGWKPAVLVDYVRYPFVYPTGNVRVTIDTELRTAPFKTNLFDDRALTVPVLDEGEAVLEVKYDAFLPAPVRALLEGVTKQRCAVSKYTKCLDILE